MNALLARIMDALPLVERPDRALLARLTRWFTGTRVLLVVTVWIAMAEVDRLIADTATETGRSGSASSLQGLDPQLGWENWGIWLGLDEGICSQVRILLAIYVCLDVLFAVLYISLLSRFFGSRKVAKLAIGTVILGELLEVATQLVGNYALGLDEQPGLALMTELAWLAVLATFLKWAGLATLAASVFVYARLRLRVSRNVGRAWNALFFHRLAFAAVLLIGALALLPIAGVNDQMPDTQRAWLNLGPGKFLITSWAALLVSFGLFYLGRRRSELAWSLYAGEQQVPDNAPRYWMWMIPQVLLVLGIGAVLLGGGHTVPVDWRTGVAMGLPLLVALVSIWMEYRGDSVAPLPPRPTSRQRAVDAWRCGDVLAMVFLAFSGMALVRSFTAPIALGIAGSLRWDAGQQWVAGLYLTFGVALAGLVFGAGALLCRATWGKFLDPREVAGSATIRISLVLLALFAIIVSAFAFLPVWTSTAAGVAGTAVLAVGSWAMVIGLATVALQRQRPPRIFEALGLRAAPVMTLIAIVLAVGSFGGGNPALHQIRDLESVQDPSVLATRPGVAKAFKDWLDRSAACGRNLARDVAPGPSAGAAAIRVRPMVLVAAEGGGIRAASWTVQAFDKLAETGGCGGDVVMASSGISGGSVGLTLSHLYGASGAVERMEALSGPNPLAAAVSGAIVGDVIASGTGLLIPTQVGAPTGGAAPRVWNDRAGLMESLWEVSAPKLAEAFDATTAGPTGALLLNSTDAGSNCRVVISQLDLPGKAAPGSNAGFQCSGAQGFPLTVDLLDRQTDCPLALRWSSAALLSARFPIISPAGRDPVRLDEAGKPTNCQGGANFQLIDGGYSEGSGLGTISDLWPALQKEVLGHNACVTAALAVVNLPAPGNAPPCPGIEATADLVAPVFVFLQNSPGADLVGRPPKAAGELAVPLVGLGARKLQSATRSWIQRLEEAGNVCPVPAVETPGEENPAGASAKLCAEATESVSTALGGQSVVVVAPNSVPALGAPLGWSLSALSQDQLEHAMTTEAGSRPDPNADVTADQGQQQPFDLLLDYLEKGKATGAVSQ
ncbi:hypothetical protein [Arthrobacter glacialis]|uniref:hypothetical protein n=1 Tax=Arthrobacter glacialis TaxID=1664 RepID=UPI000CD3C7E7|nr:hypothetical protein [Arthrobacter glacialis]POH56899.1 hypothetical protein CVS28_18395 [Arthrobacter glacialis]